MNQLQKLPTIFRTSEALQQGVHPSTLYGWRDNGLIEELARGVFRQAKETREGFSDAVIVAKRIPKSVICLLSALAFHEMTTQIPHAVSVAISPKDRQPVLSFPPIEVFRFSGDSFEEGIETYIYEDVLMRVYCPAKTVADCFKFRNRIGLDVALESLKSYLEQKKGTVSELLQYARICRVEKIITPYVEALI